MVLTEQQSLKLPEDTSPLFRDQLGSMSGNPTGGWKSYHHGWISTRHGWKPIQPGWKSIHPGRKSNRQTAWKSYRWLEIFPPMWLDFLPPGWKSIHPGWNSIQPGWKSFHQV